MTYRPTECPACGGCGIEGGHAALVRQGQYAALPPRCPRCDGTGKIPRCCYCGTTERELRPYGIDGLPCCRPCVDGSPERTATARAAFAAIADAAAAASPIGVAAITDDGIVPGSLPPT